MGYVSREKCVEMVFEFNYRRIAHAIRITIEKRV